MLVGLGVAFRPAFVAVHATALRVEDGAITEIVSVTDRALEEFWTGA